MAESEIQESIKQRRKGTGSSYYYYDEGDDFSYRAEDVGQKNLKDYLIILRERIWYILIVFLLVLSGVLVYTFNLTPVYRSTATVQILRSDAAVVQFQDVVDTDVRSAEDLNTQIKVLESGVIIDRVAGRLGSDLLRSFLAPYQRNSEEVSLKSVLRNNRQVVPQRASMVVAIQYSHPNPEVAAAVANLFVEEFLAHSLSIRIDESMRAVRDLELRAEEQRKKLEASEFRLQEYRERFQAVSLEQRTDIATDRLRKLNLAVTDADQVFSRIETNYNLVVEFREAGKPLTELSFISNHPLVSELLSKIANQKIEIAQLAERYRAQHPRMIEATSNLRQSETELANVVDSTVAKLASDYQAARRNFEESARALEEQERELLRLSRLSVEYDTIAREAEVKDQLYRYLLGRISETSVTGSLENVNVRPLDAAVAASRPVIPNIPLNLALGLIGGLGLGVGLAFFIGFLDDRVKSAYDVESNIGLPLIGVLPEIKKLRAEDKAHVVAQGKERQVIEAFRSVHSVLRLNEDSRHAQAIMVTSTLPGEGKSFVSANLALTFAEHGEKTILVDCDLRMPNVHGSFGLKNGAGVIDFCLGESGLDGLIQPAIYGNFDVLTTGGRSKSPTQLLSSDRFSALIEELRKRYSRIIVDTPPLAAVSDALAISSAVDGALYTIKFNKVKRKAAKHNLRRLEESKTPVFGAILNSLSMNGSGYYYHTQYYDKSYQNYYLVADETHSDPLR